jgi:hypothetical protein
MTEQIIPQTEQLYQVFSARRSGHHLAIQHLAACLEATGFTSVHVNDVDNNLSPSHPKRVNWTVAEVLAHGALAGALIVNYEDYSFDGRSQSPMYRGLAASGIPSTDVIVVRDVYNLAASRVAKMAEAERECQSYQFDVFSLIHGLDRWVEHANVALGPQQEGVVPILYNHLVDRTDPARQQKVAAQLGLVHSNNGLDQVPEFGGGSSVDGQTFDGRAQEMNVLQRWLDLPPDQLEWFLGAVDYGELDTLNRQLFGFGMAEVRQSLSADI